MFEMSIRTTVICNTCYQEEISEEPTSILHLQPLKSLQTAIDSFLKSEQLTVDNARFCNFCSSIQPATLEKRICKCGSYVIIQLQRFNFVNGSLKKDASLVEIAPDVPKLPLHLDREISFSKQLSLKAVINHFGSLSNGHYTASVLDKFSDKWFNCNDRAVLPTSKKDLNNNFTYL